ncbi:MAG: GNAT family N-acetyltransferase [Candidatus Lindowbacteria bacterium]|nr:GNAT family N-acetyltransferase [Candidatus Lindowbacteria bacterium]
MAAPLRELVLNEARALAVFGAGRLTDHRFAVSLICDELPDMRFNRAYVLDAANLTTESLEELSRDFLSSQLSFRMDIFLPILPETETLLNRRGFDLTEDYASEMTLTRPSTRLMGNRAVRIERLSPQFLDAFSTILVKAYNTPPDMVATLVSIFRHTIPRALEHKGAALYLAFLGSEPVGALYLFAQGGVAGLYNLAVALPSRRQGVATTLMLRAIEDSLIAGHETVCLQTGVGTFHERFFERLGFCTVARRKRAMRRKP